MIKPGWKSFIEFAAENKLLSPIVLSILKQSSVLEKHNQFVVKISNIGGYSFLQKNIRVVESVLKDYYNDDGVSFAIELEEKKVKPITPVATPILAYKPTVDELLQKSGLKTTLSFKTFAVSTSNNLAYAAALATAKSPGNSYNPLFLYGGVGVGKTHLAQAIGRKMLEDNNESQIFFAPGDMFTNEVIESIRERKTAQLRKKYRKLDLLIIDDVQFIAGKEAIQEEFFHTFNSIVSKGGQIILTSDKSPHEIKNLEDRLRSRFSGGLMVDIKKPDFELKTAIILIKSEEKGLHIDIEGAKIIAEHSGDTRELEGTLLMIQAKSFAEQVSVTSEYIQRYFEEKYKTDIQNSSSVANSKPLPNDIIRIISSYYNIKQSHIKSSIRTESVALPRQIVMYILRNKLHMTLESIAYLLKRKDHTTIIHGISKIEKLITRDIFFKEEIDRIIKSIHLP